MSAVLWFFIVASYVYITRDAVARSRNREGWRSTMWACVAIIAIGGLVGAFLRPLIPTS